MTGDFRSTPGSVRTAIYVDGFNLYYGLMDKGWGRYRWLDIRALAERIAKPPAQIVAVRYFTARSSHPPDRYKRHTLYLDALRKVCAVDVREGRMNPRDRICPKCGHPRRVNDEKQTDVNMALAMVTDAIDDVMDEAVLISADSDLIPAVKLLQERWHIPVMAVDPPRRHSNELRDVAARHRYISRSSFSGSQLANPATYVHRGKIKTLHRPPLWETDDASPAPVGASGSA